MLPLGSVSFRLLPSSTSDFSVTVSQKLNACTVSTKLNAWYFTNTWQSATSLIRNTAKCCAHARLFHYGECNMLLQMEKSAMRDVKCSSRRCKGSSFTFSVWWNMRVRDWRKNLKIMNVTSFRPKRVGNVKSKNNSPVNIRFFRQNIRHQKFLSKHQI